MLKSYSLKLRAFCGALACTAGLLASCSREDINPVSREDLNPVPNATTKAAQVNAFTFNGGNPVNNGAYFQALFDSGVPFYGQMNGHTEMADIVTIEFSRGTDVVLIARHIGLGYNPGSSGNDGRIAIGYNVPILLPGGSYTMTLRTESANQSLQVATTGDPSTYVHTLSTPVSIVRSSARLVGSITDPGHSMNQRYYKDYTIRWAPELFPINTQSLRALAINSGTGTMYEMYSSQRVMGAYPQNSFENLGSDHLILNGQANNFATPESLPNGFYTFSVDDYGSNYITGDGITVFTPGGPVGGI